MHAGFDDEAYAAAGAKIVETREEILRVKEPQPDEYELLRTDQILFTYLHLAASESLTRELMKRQVKAVAYETSEAAH